MSAYTSCISCATLSSLLIYEALEIVLQQVQSANKQQQQKKKQAQDAASLWLQTDQLLASHKQKWDMDVNDWVGGRHGYLRSPRLEHNIDVLPTGALIAVLKGLQHTGSPCLPHAVPPHAHI